MDMVNLIEHLNADGVIDLARTVLFSRSIGCMFLTYLSAIYKLKACVMYYPFTSVKGVVKSKFGAFVALGVQENDFQEPIHYIKQNLNPTLIVHGEQDELIDTSHAYSLMENSGSQCEVKIIQDMGHEIDLRFEHLIIPLNRFFIDHIYPEG